MKVESVVQPIARDDGTLAVSDEEIFEEMKKRYGKESLDVKENEPAWYESVEEEAVDKNIDKRLKIKERKYADNCSHKNRRSRESHRGIIWIQCT